MTRTRFSLLLGVTLLLAATAAGTEPPPKTAPSGFFQQRTGMGVADRLLASKDEPDRWRAIERLGALGTPEALDLVGRLLDTEAAKSARIRLIAARALAPHGAELPAYSALVRLMTSGESIPGCPSELDQWVRTSAALGLAASQTPRALTALGQALRHEGPVALAAAEALVAHPPKELLPLLGARGAATVTLVEALERLGDQRAFAFLRDVVRTGSPTVRARAAIALTRLGDFETVELGRYWLEHESSRELRQAAAWVLVLARAREAPRSVLELLRDPDTAPQGLELALASPTPALVPELERRLATCNEDCERLLSAIGRAGGVRAAQLLAARLGHPRLGRSAAYALALAPGQAARQALAGALRVPTLRALVARAAVVREITLGERIRGLDTALEVLFQAADPDQRAAGAWGTAVRHPDRARGLISNRDPVIVRAAARALIGAPDAPWAAERWTAEADPVTRAALGVGLVSWDGADRVPTEVLLVRIRRADPLAPLLARALAARDSADLRPEIEALLASGDPSVRGHAALGLARSRQPGAVALLDRSYRFETDPGVRRAIVSALSARAERATLRTLRLAAELDPDESTRSAARWALAGHELGTLEAGPGVVWLDLASEARTIPTVATVTTSTGLAVPVVTDPGGLIVAVGLPRGPVGVRLTTLER